MSLRLIGTVLALLLVLSGSAQALYIVSQNITNTDPYPWFGIHAIYGYTSSPPNVLSHYDGPSNNHFNTFTYIGSGGEGQPNWAELRWRNYSDGSDNDVDTGQSIQIGWSLDNASAPPSCYIKWMRWEAQNGSGYF